MTDDRRVDVEAAVTAKPEAKAQVHVLEIAEIARVEPADLVESVPAVERGRGAWRKDFAVIGGPSLGRDR